jgi:hypothetical protein
MSNSFVKAVSKSISAVIIRRLVINRWMMSRDAREPRLEVSSVLCPELAGASVQYNSPTSVSGVQVATILRVPVQHKCDCENTDHECNLEWLVHAL